MKLLKWFYPGMRVKRWMLLSAVGLVLCVLGGNRALANEGLTTTLAGSAVLLVGVVLFIAGIRKMVKSLIGVLLPKREQELVDIVFRQRHLERGPKVVVIGGGTGLSNMLLGMKQYTSKITAVVTVADDGGSSGRLREELDVPPPGDIRNCLVALADAEPLMRELFQYRFNAGTGLQGHSFGNLFITAMLKITGDFQAAVRESSRVLVIRGQVVPSTTSQVRLVAEHEDGSRTVGESRIATVASRVRRLSLEPAHCEPTSEAIEAIEEADAIILGPGSLYTSILPNLLIRGIPEAVMRSKAIKIYVCNVMTQQNESTNYSAADHLRAIIDHTYPQFADYCVVNTAPVPEPMLEKYRSEGSYPVEVDADRLETLGARVVAERVISTKNYVRHDPDLLAKALMQIILGQRLKPLTVLRK